jgi:hypothetical protein
MGSLLFAGTHINLFLVSLTLTHTTHHDVLSLLFQTNPIPFSDIFTPSYVIVPRRWPRERRSHTKKSLKEAMGRWCLATPLGGHTIRHEITHSVKISCSVFEVEVRRATFGGHRRDHHGTQMIVHFGRGRHNTRTRLPDLAPHGGIEIHKPNLPTHHQVSSASAALPNSPITSARSPAWAIVLAASAQPVRTGLAGLLNTSAPPSMVISAPASELSSSCIRTGLGMTTPCELPICRMLT